MIMAKLGIIQDEEDNFRFVLKKLKMNFTEGKFALIGMILPGHIDVELMATVVLDMLIITFCERMQIWSNSSSSFHYTVENVLIVIFYAEEPTQSSHSTSKRSYRFTTLKMAPDAVALLADTRTKTFFKVTELESKMHGSAIACVPAARPLSANALRTGEIPCAVRRLIFFDTFSQSNFREQKHPFIDKKVVEISLPNFT